MSARIPTGVLVIAALALCACRAAPPADTSRNTVTVIAKDFAFELPSEIPAGLTTFKLVNRGPSLHHIQLIRLEEGKTGDDYLAALKAGGPPPAWATPAGGPNPPEVGDTALTTMEMKPGTYLLVCFIPSADGVPHFIKGMTHTLMVTAPTRAAAPEPAADLVVKLVDFDFQLSQPLTAGRHTIRIENGGAQPHEVAFIRLEPGKTPADFTAWGERPEGSAPGRLFGGVSAIMPGARAFVELDLPPGEYALICFVPEMADGKPHFVHGMMKQVTVG
jgi:hypothetical protein